MHKATLASKDLMGFFDGHELDCSHFHLDSTLFSLVSASPGLGLDIVSLDYCPNMCHDVTCRTQEIVEDPCAEGLLAIPVHNPKSELLT